MLYLCVLDNTYGKYIFPDFYGNIFKSVQSNIDSKAYPMFGSVFERFYKFFQQYKSWVNICDHNFKIIVRHWNTIVFIINYHTLILCINYASVC